MFIAPRSSWMFILELLILLFVLLYVFVLLLIGLGGGIILLFYYEVYDFMGLVKSDYTIDVFDGLCL